MSERRLRVRLEWKPQDLWIGVYWKRSDEQSRAILLYDVWICILPMLPIHLTWHRENPEWAKERARVDAYLRSREEGRG